jgi:hypothetical protein
VNELLSLSSKPAMEGYLFSVPKAMLFFLLFIIEEQVFVTDA